MIMHNDSGAKEEKSELGRILNKNLFVHLLDIEIKRARRYQNFLCLLVLHIKSHSETDVHACQFQYQKMSGLLGKEVREGDLLGFLEENKMAVLLPFADAGAGGQVKSRFETILKYYDFKNKECEVMIHKICFPLNGTNTADILKQALWVDASSS
jgi:hypothetical protein